MCRGIVDSGNWQPASARQTVPNGRTAEASEQQLWTEGPLKQVTWMKTEK